MSYNSSQITALPSGTYAILSSRNEAVMTPKRPRSIDCTLNAPLFQVLHSFILILVIIYSRRTMQWDVQYNEGGYTIQIHNQPLYIVTQNVRA